MGAKNRGPLFRLVTMVFSRVGQVAWVMENKWVNRFINKLFSAPAGDSTAEEKEQSHEEEK